MHVKILKFTDEPFISASGWNKLGKLEIAVDFGLGPVYLRDVVAKQKDNILWFNMPSRKDKVTGEWSNFVEMGKDLDRQFQGALSQEFKKYISQAKPAPNRESPVFPDEPWEGTPIPDDMKRKPLSMKDLAMDEVPF